MIAYESYESAIKSEKCVSSTQVNYLCSNFIKINECGVQSEDNTPSRISDSISLISSETESASITSKSMLPSFANSCTKLPSYGVYEYGKINRMKQMVNETKIHNNSIKAQQKIDFGSSSKKEQ